MAGSTGQQRPGRPGVPASSRMRRQWIPCGTCNSACKQEAPRGSGFRLSTVLVDCFDVPSLEAFTAELVAAGFEPITGSRRRRWRGPIHSAFATLTKAATMDIAIVPGWPFQPPALFVAGLDTNHSTLAGLVCMWREGDPSLRWLTVEGLFARIVEWCENAKGGWENDDLRRDAILNFQPKCGILATFDLSALGTGRGGWGDFHGVANSDPFRVELKPGHGASTKQLRGIWFRVGEIVTPPPRQLSEVSRCLSRTQRRGLERALSNGCSLGFTQPSCGFGGSSGSGTSSRRPPIGWIALGLVD